MRLKRQEILLVKWTPASNLQTRGIQVKSRCMQNFEQQQFNLRNARGEPPVSVLDSASFFGKVMTAFGFAMLLSAAGAYSGFQYFGPIFLAHPGYIWVAYALELLLVFTSRIWSTRYPLNYLLFGLFAFSSGLTVVPLLASVIVQFGGPQILMKALMATAFAFTAAAIFGWTTNRSLSGFRGFLLLSLIGMIITSIIGIFLPWSNSFEMIFSGFGVIVFSGYTMYDFQRLKTYPSDRFIDAALALYLDMFNLFLYILRLISSNQRR